MKRTLLSLFVLLSAACGAAAGDQDPTGSTAEAVSNGDVAGAYTGQAGAPLAAIVFDAEKNTDGEYPYFLEENGGLISCRVGTGCTETHVREEGHYSATATHVTVHPSSGSERVYSYTRNGDDLTLTREGETGTFTEVASYCDTPSDCPGEGLIRPDCASATSSWECNAHACSYACSGAP